ncbi:MAG TPA: DNA methyltransferase [Chitinophagaceae bacterium]|nr:DNA methyltransferase [Chitinophagaceae bacterium]
MPLSWNEIKDRALAFSKEWADTYNEDAEAKPFLEAFFNVFGITRKKIATFEHKVKKLDTHDGYIDLFWKGVFLVEMKSKGKNLDKAYKQAREYLQTVPIHELPQYILICDFETFRLYDYEKDTGYQFLLKDLVNNVQHFGFIAGYIKREFKEQDPVNIKAAALMGKLHDRLKDIGYTGHPLELYLVRLLFCLFAEDTTIFNKGAFYEFITTRTADDGSDLAARLSELFFVLNTPEDKRLKYLDESLKAFPYVNGKLFEETLPPAAFDTSMRLTLLECCTLDWGTISPAIFGSMFQSVMNPVERRNLGAHYTSEKNIMKLIKPLFLDGLWQEFESVKGNRNRLADFHKKLSQLKFLDPACGCGNFLVITYRELRLLEIEILRAMNRTGQGFLNVSEIIWLDVDMMYGIEYEEFPAQIAQVAMWLIDHQMNMAVSSEFGQYFVRLPLKKAAKIIHGNALQIEWGEIVAKNELSYILGNPPFIGKHLQTANQKADLEKVFKGYKGFGVLDYVTAWYLSAAKFIARTKIKVAFVSTNSIVQGEQVGILWNLLFNHYAIKIHFAHTTFSWSNEAKGNAAVHVVIIGFANYDATNKTIYQYEDIKGEPHEIKVKNINPYLVDGKDFALSSRNKPICAVPEMIYGNKIVDGGHYLFTDKEKNEFIRQEPYSAKFFLPILSGDEFINGKNRWVLYLADAAPNEIRGLPLVKERIEEVKKFRQVSAKMQTREFANTPTLFAEPRQPQNDYLLIPRTSSENRKYLPLGFFSKTYIVNDSCIALPNATNYHFGVLSSVMHTIWVKYVCGRLKSDFRYSNSIVYNNYPWPLKPTEKQKQAVESAAQAVLSARAQYPDSSLADLYNPLAMPPVLVKAHNALDKAVDLCYRQAPFTSDANRMEFLFDLYEKYTADLFTKEKVKKKAKPEKK